MYVCVCVYGVVGGIRGNQKREWMLDRGQYNQRLLHHHLAPGRQNVYLFLKTLLRWAHGRDHGKREDPEVDIFYYFIYIKNQAKITYGVRNQQGGYPCGGVYL